MSESISIHYKEFANGKINMKTGNKVIGTIRVRDYNQPAVYVSYLNIIDEYKNIGLGSVLLNNIIERVKDKEAISLYVAVTNVGAIRFYRRHGFHIVCTTESKITKTEKHYMMTKRLNINSDSLEPPK